MFLQLAWGGIYTDADLAAANMDKAFSAADEIVAALENEKKLQDDSRLRIIASDFYGGTWYLTGNEDQGEGPVFGSSIDVLAEVLRWLKR